MNKGYKKYWLFLVVSSGTTDFPSRYKWTWVPFSQVWDLHYEDLHYEDLHYEDKTVQTVFIFIMGISLPVKHLYIETVSWKTTFC